MKSIIKRSKDGAKKDIIDIFYALVEYGLIAVFLLMFLVARKLFKAGPEYRFDFGVVAASLALNGIFIFLSVF